jgi:hypothetical protein
VNRSLSIFPFQPLTTIALGKTASVVAAARHVSSDGADLRPRRIRAGWAKASFLVVA